MKARPTHKVNAGIFMKLFPLDPTMAHKPALNVNEREMPIIDNIVGLFIIPNYIPQMVAVPAGYRANRLEHS
jgi:hypothetical protein